MTNTLISCVGRRDPYDNTLPYFYGSLLACLKYILCKKKKLARVILITTPEFDKNIQAVIKHIQNIDSTIEISQLETKLEDPSDYNLVDSTFRRLLEPIARTTKQSATFINLSSGTQQMTQTLSLMMVTEFLNATGLSVKNPIYNLYEPAEKLSDLPLQESAESLISRVGILDKMQIPAVKHITKSVIISLIRNNNFSQALELLEDFKNSESITTILEPLLKTSENLMLLDITSAKSIFENVKIKLRDPKFNDKYENKIKSIESALNSQISILSYWITEIRLKQKRYDDFIRCAGLTREECLNLALKNSRFNVFYDSWIIRSNSKYLINKAELKRLNIELYNDCFKKSQKSNIVDLNNPPNENYSKEHTESFNNHTMLVFLQYAANQDKTLQKTVNAFYDSEDLIFIRNNYSHTIRKIQLADVEKAKKCFEKLKTVLPGYENMETVSSVFKFIRELSIEIIKYWSD